MIKFTIISVLAVLVSACARRAVAENDLLQQVEFAWEGQRSAIVSAEIQYRYMAIRGDNSLTPVEVAELFAAHDLEQDSSLFEPVLRVLAPTLPVDKPAWMNATLRMSVDKIREEVSYDGKRLRTHVVNDGLKILQSDLNGQTDIGGSSQIAVKVISVSDIRFLPKPGNYSVEQQDGRFAILTAKNLILDVEVDTGWVRSGSLGNLSERHTEIRQFLPVVYAGDIVFPTITFYLKYSAGKLSVVQAFYIEEAKFNLDIPDDQFNVSAEHGHNIFDYRPETPKDSSFVPVSTATTDVVKTANENVLRAAASPPQSIESWKLKVAVVSVSVLALLFVVSVVFKRSFS